MTTSTERAALDAIDRGALLHDLAELIAIPSLGATEAPAQAWMAARLRSMGLEVDEWTTPVAALRAHPAFSMEVEREHVHGVVGTLHGGDGPTLILNGHVDVVPPADLAQWTSSPWEAREHAGHVFGRGACDMKGGLAAALAAIRAIRASGVPLPGHVALHSVVAEEDGGAGTLATLLRGHTGDGAISMEPTRLAIAPSHAGALSFRLTVQGLATHGAVREEGVSAIEKFEIVHRALLHLEASRHERLRDPLFAAYRRPFALSIGTVQAGDWPSSVPDLLTCEGRYGIAPGEDSQAAQREFELAVADAAAQDSWLRDHMPRVEWWGGRFEPARTDPASAIIAITTGAAADVLGRAPSIEGMTYGADMRLLVNEGKIPAVLFGPGDVRRAHRPDECVPIDDLLVVARTLVLAALRFGRT